jgi:cation transport regulator ChaB
MKDISDTLSNGFKGSLGESSSGLSEEEQQRELELELAALMQENERKENDSESLSKEVASSAVNHEHVLGTNDTVTPTHAVRISPNKSREGRDINEEAKCSKNMSVLPTS